jgi:hypothetical protein
VAAHLLDGLAEPVLRSMGGWEPPEGDDQ